MHRFFTGLFAVSPQNYRVILAHLDKLMADVSVESLRGQRLETKIHALEAEVEADKAALNKLRGQVHGPKGAGVERPAARQVTMLQTKDELRRRAGIIAGQPARHVQEEPENDQGV